MEYPKIHSLFKRQFTERDPETGETRFLDKGKSGNPFIIGEYSEPEFANIKRWRVDEKIDGTNIRITLDRKNMSNPMLFEGRTKNSAIPSHLIKSLQETFVNATMIEEIDFMFQKSERVIFFGEGYGPKIQACGGNYDCKAGFMLFDVFIDGWWLKRDDMRGIADKLNLKAVPDLGVMTEEEVVNFVKSKPLSRCSQTPQMMEGVICRTEPLMVFRNGKPIMFKLKCKDFING